MQRARTTWRAASVVLASACATTLLWAGTAFGCGPQAKMQLEPNVAPPGDVVQGTGTDFTAGADVRVYFGTPSNGRLVARLVVGTTRTISFTFPVPDVPPGPYLVSAVQTDPTGRVDGSPVNAALEVVAPPPTTTTTTTTTTTPPSTMTATSTTPPLPETPVSGSSVAPASSAPTTAAPRTTTTTRLATVGVATGKAADGSSPLTLAPLGPAAAVDSVAPTNPAPGVAASGPGPDPSGAARQTWPNRTVGLAARGSKTGEEREGGGAQVLLGLVVLATAATSAIGWRAIRSHRTG